MLLQQKVFDVLKVLLECLVIRQRPEVGVEQFVHGRLFTQSGGTFPGKQPGHKFRAVGGHFKERFVDQVLQHILAADIDDERDLRTDGGNVSKILFRSDAQVNAIGLCR